MMMPAFRPFLLFLCLAAVRAPWSACAGQATHPEWIFCDDFEKTPAVTQGGYFEYNTGGGTFVPQDGAGMSGTRGMRAHWETAQVEAGNLKVSFGRAPGSFGKGIRAGEDFREVYYRVFLRLQTGWKGDPYKLSRTTVLAKADWSQAMIAHLWGDQSDHLQLDPVRCVDGSSLVKCAGYNDFKDMEWIGAKAGATALFDSKNSGKWTCVEVHVKLNDAGQSNGVHEFWLDDHLEARRENLNFLGSYKDYGLNAVFLENYWNSGSPQAQDRFFDDFVVSTQRVGCADAAATGLLPQGTIQMKKYQGVGKVLGLSGLPGLPGAAAVGRVDGKVVGAGARGAAGIYVGLPDRP